MRRLFDPASRALHLDERGLEAPHTPLHSGPARPSLTANVPPALAGINHYTNLCGERFPRRFSKFGDAGCRDEYSASVYPEIADRLELLGAETSVAMEGEQGAYKQKWRPG